MRKILATFFGTGFVPFFPGTAASALAAFLYVLLEWTRQPPLLDFVVFLALAIGGIFLAPWATKTFRHEDPKEFVLDEAAGLFLTANVAKPHSFLGVFGIFLLFRVFDILKPFPIRRVELLPRGFGIVADDLVAGAYAGGSFLLVAFLWPQARSWLSIP